jgi:predicted dinucleotide-utilizing enzyme
VTSVLVVGVGAIGNRAGRVLADTAGFDRILIADRRHERAEALRRHVGARATVVEWSPRRPIPDGVDVIACALPPGDDVPLVLAALDAGVPVATSGDEHDGIATLLRLDGEARDRGVTVLAGCGLAPGLSDVLAAHAATLLDSVDEIHVARAGIAGAKSEASLRRVHSDRPVEVREGAISEVRRRTTHELVHFPEPVGAQECEMVGVGVDLLADAFPGADRITVRAVEPPPRTRGLFHREDPGGRWGATRVEVWGRVGDAKVPVVYGAAGRTAAVGGTVLAVATAALAGVVPAVDGTRHGVHGLASVAGPTAFLAELAARGVTAARFEGVPVS